MLKGVKMKTLLDEVMDMLMEADPFTNAPVQVRSASTVKNIPSLQPVRLAKEFCSSMFPPSNVGFNKATKEMIIQVSLVGLTEDDFLLDLDNDDLVLNIKSNPEANKDIVFPQRGLKLATNEKISWRIDPLYYDRDAIKTDFKNGLLTIVIEPLEKRKPKKISLMGNRKLLEEKKNDESEDEKSED